MRRLRVATVGAGYFGRFHLDGWARIEEVELAAVCDSDAAKGADCAARWSIPRAYTCAAAMLEHETLDLLDIVTPPPSHLALIRLAAEHGIATICQKPFCGSLEEAELAAALASVAGTLLVVHENFRFQPWYAEIKRQVDAGAIGETYQGTFRLRPGDGQGPRAYLDRQPYFRGMDRFLVHETAIHFIDTFRYLLGEVEAVYADLRRLNAAVAGEDAGFILFRHRNGARSLFDGNRLADHPARDRRLTMGEMLLEGSGGTLRLDGDGRLFHRPFGANREGQIRYAWADVGFGGDCVRRLQRHVVDHLLGRGGIVNAAREYLHNRRIEEAIYRSARDATAKVV